MGVWVVVGGQFGSEGKGKIAAWIVRERAIDICVRCGGPNSGHSFVDDDGHMVTLRQLPTGFVRPEARLLIPAGGLIDLNVLRSEIALLGLDHSRIGIDRHAMIISPQDRLSEESSGLRERLSSTLCGVGSAVARRALRSADVQLAREVAETEAWLQPYLTNVSEEVNLGVNRGSNVLIEGTQGSGLSLYHSEHYPRTTSRDTNVSGFLSEVGVSPMVVTEVVLVLRTFPIRVSGEQAGPLFQELSWEQMSAEAGFREPVHEFTTVSRKLRRLGRFDWSAIVEAIQLNRPTKLALNFTDYLDARNSGARSYAGLTSAAQNFVEKLERFGVPVSWVGTGPALADTIALDYSKEDREEGLAAGRANW